jgi:hypothetical protein
MSEQDLRRRLHEAELPDESGARARGWRVVRAAYVEQPSGRPARNTSRRLALALFAAGLVLALALSPAGAKVGDVLRSVAGIDSKSEPVLTSLPARGRLLVESPVGPWVVNDDGSKRLLGDYQQATWSPGGLYVGVTGGRELAAVEPGGTIHWTLDGSNLVRDPQWSPSGFRVAYRSGNALRVVAGDGTGDHLLARSVAPTPLAWEPLSPARASQASQDVSVPELAAYVESSGRIVIANVDSGQIRWSTSPGIGPDHLSWSSDGKLLLATGPAGIAAYDPAKSANPVSVGFGSESPVSSATFVPGTHRIVAIYRVPDGAGHAVSRVVTGPAGVKLFLSHTLLSTRERLTDLVPSPDGRWLLTAEPARDRWIFVRTTDGRMKVATNIAHQFDPGASGPVSFPHAEGWCCTG